MHRIFYKKDFAELGASFQDPSYRGCYTFDTYFSEQPSQGHLARFF